MDESLEDDSRRKLQRLAEHPDFDLHLRMDEHRVEGYIWSDGRRFRLIGVRDEEGVDGGPAAATGPPPGESPRPDGGRGSSEH